MFERHLADLRSQLNSLAGRQDARDLQMHLYRELGCAAVADALELAPEAPAAVPAAELEQVAA